MKERGFEAVPVCPNCGKEVGEGVVHCNDCGERLKKGFTPEERQQYIEELQASIEEEKSDNKAKLTNGQLEREGGTAENEPPFILGQQEKLVLDAPHMTYFGVSVHNIGAFGGGTYSGLFGGLTSSKQVKREKSIWDAIPCHAYVTNLRVLFVKAKRNILSGRDTKLQNVISDISLDSIEGIVSGAKLGSPTVELAVKFPDGSINNIAFAFLALGFNKPRLAERDEWIKMIGQCRANVPKSLSTAADHDDPLKVLKLRYAKGEITKEEYEQMRRDLV